MKELIWAISYLGFLAAMSYLIIYLLTKYDKEFTAWAKKYDPQITLVMLMVIFFVLQGIYETVTSHPPIQPGQQATIQYEYIIPVIEPRK